ncbi:hypothetical protein KIP88_45145, partial [Bradyrhizobium sp. SRL28]|uniref:hypothetical protein n=1 Tax=Bradyrhizobium sp. SRL28 TaxID=2836178 RepID=UPI001BDE3440
MISQLEGGRRGSSGSVDRAWKTALEIEAVRSFFDLDNSSHFRGFGQQVGGKGVHSQVGYNPP